MGTLLKLVIFMTILNAGLYVLQLSSTSTQGFLDAFINSQTKTTGAAVEGSTPTQLYGASFQSGTTAQGFFNLIDPINAIVGVINMLSGFLGGFLLFCISTQMPTWFTYLFALPLTVAYWFSLAALVRGVSS